VEDFDEMNGGHLFASAIISLYHTSDFWYWHLL